MKSPTDPVAATAASATGMTSPTLLERLKAQDAQAWQRLVNLYGPLVFQWCRRCQLPAEDAADISQEVFQSVATHIRAFRRDSVGHTFRGWLWTITRNKIRDYFRRREDEPAACGGSTAQMRFHLLPEQLPDDDAEQSATDALVQRALDLIRSEFNERHWQMSWRTTIQGQAPAEIAADFGVTPDAVRMAKSRVLRRLREELAEED